METHATVGTHSGFEILYSDFRWNSDPDAAASTWDDDLIRRAAGSLSPRCHEISVLNG
jgi:hypothetical protein